MNQFHKIIRLCAIGFALFLIVSIFGGLFGIIRGLERVIDHDREPSPGQTLTISEEIRHLEIEVNAAEVKLVLGEAFQVQISDDRVQVEQAKGKLRIREDRWFQVGEGCTITVIIPAQAILDEVDITVGGGVIRSEGLYCRDFDLEIGAGKAAFSNLEVTGQADVDGGAGEIIIDGGTIRNLDLSMGVGNGTIRSTLTGRSDVESGIGKLELTILGDRADYTITANKGIGEIRVDGMSMDESRLGSGEHRLDVEGGIGKIEIVFEP